MKRLNVASPIIGTNEKNAVQKVLDSGIIAQGPVVAQLEKDFAAYCGTKYAVALNSGTAAIHTALYTLGIGEGDEVITTPFSFIATVNPILMVGASPKFADIKEGDFNIDPKKVESAITKRTKAIIAVDLYGQPYDFEELSRIASMHGIELIEDACQAVGAKYGDKMAGSFGSAGCFSLYATKNIMSGEGGILTTNSEKVVESAKQFRQHGMTGPYEYADLGYNLRMTDILAAIGVEQLKQVDEFNRLRQRNARQLNEGLAGIDGIITPTINKGRTHVFHQYTIRITPDFAVTRERLIEILNEHEIGSGVYYPKALHLYPHIAKLGFSDGDFPVAEKTSQEVLSLPVHPGIEPADIQRIVEVITGAASE